MSWESFEEFGETPGTTEGFSESRGPIAWGPTPGPLSGAVTGTAAVNQQQALSDAAEKAAQDAQVQDVIDQLSSIGYDVGGRRSAAAAAGWDPTGTYGGKGYQPNTVVSPGIEGFVDPHATLYTQASPAIEDLLSYYSSRPDTPAGRTDSPAMTSPELYDVFGLRNQTSLPNYDPSVFDIKTPQETQAAATDALKEVNKIDPSKTLTGDAAQLAAFREMGYKPEMAKDWEAARNTWGDFISGFLQGTSALGWAGQIFNPEATDKARSSLARGIDDLLGTHAPERNPWNASGTGINPKMDRDTFVGLAADIPPTTSGFRGPPIDDWSEGDDGNVQAIRRFLQTPTYGNIPQIDPASALAAYENAIRGIDAVVDERGFTGQGYAQAARDRSKTIFDELLPGQDVDTMLNEKIGRAFAEEALFAKEGEFRQQGIESINQAFPEGFSSEIFDPKAFSDAAENIYGQKLGGAQDIIARAGSRGQLSPRGGRLASESLLSQGPDVRSGISDIVSGVRSGLESGLEGIRGSALEQAQGYKLGDELFDVQPFTQQASDYLSERAPAIGTEISEAIGTDPLFDAVSALQEGGRQQGVVSGTPSFLDVLAERESTPGTGRDRRGLGSRGSGVF